MPLTKNREVEHYIDQELRSIPVAADQVIFKGSFVGLSPSGLARPLQAGDPFAGIAYEQVNNAGGNDAELNIRVYTIGDFGFALPGAGREHIGRPAFAGDDEVLTLDAAGNSYVGTIRDYLSQNDIILRADSLGRSTAGLTHHVENLGAGADISPRAIFTFDRDAWIIAVRLVNQALPAAGVNDGNSCTVTVGTTAGTIAQIEFNASTPFPSPNSHVAVPILTNGRVFSRDTITLAVTNQGTANPGTFIVIVDYV